MEIIWSKGEADTKPLQLQNLIEELQNPDDRRRRAASYKLGRSKDAAAVRPLIEAFEDTDPIVKQNALDGLRAIGSPEALDFLAAHPTPPSPASKPTNPFTCVAWFMGISLATGLLWALVGLLSAFAPGRAAAGAAYLLSRPVLEFVAVFMVGVLSPILGSLFRVSDPDYRKSDTAWEHLLGRWSVAVSGIAVVLLVATSQPSGLASIGLYAASMDTNMTTVINVLLAFFGFLAVLGLLLRWRMRHRKAAAPAKLDTSRFQIWHVLLYQGRWQRLALLVETCVAVISEDLVFRGYLVLLMGQRTGSYIPWAILSVALSVVIHLYQGRELRFIAFHVIAAGIFVALTVLTHNLLAAIVPHLLYDVFWTISVWRQARAQDLLAPAPKGTAQEAFSYGLFVGINGILLMMAFFWLVA